MDARPRLVIVGNGMAGARLIDAVARRAPDRYATLALGAEPTAAYNRILLSSLLAGETTLPEIMQSTPRDALVLTGESVTVIDRPNRRLTTDTGRDVPYDALVLATGSRPIVLPVPGADLPGVMTFRDLGDVERLIAAARRGERAVVIGGGLLGLEAADGLRRRGMDVTVVHLMPTLMERQLDARAGMLLQAALEARGLRFAMGAETAAISGTTQATGVELKDGRCLPADLVVMAVGIAPNTALARDAGLICRRGVVVDDAMRTSDPAIYAVGECAEHRGSTYGLVAPLWEQVDVCAAQLAGESAARYEGSLTATSLKVTGIDIYAVGELTIGETGEAVVFTDAGRGVYRKLVVRDDRLVGAVLYGDAADGPWYAEWIRESRRLGAARGDLVFGQALAAA